ncbi:rhomboid family intramembrane serine protease [Nitrosococcus watsonii]|uniref:Rhomboid family protein n=1 Tax=Nitrosococcus watsoni (strain C-113) TaxID=105559 RepID=D8KBX5_NITWC|nr:rhomboid family intramembrane serine protease [Nitrosococcus watsonii]ADJ27736.1 Rhomboid family protein [Nitrosococcus watsonii C-113]
MFPIRNPSPTSTLPVTTIGLIGICIIVFLWECSLSSREFAQAVYHFAVTPVFFLNKITPADSPIPIQLTLITSMFLHAGTWHLASNLLFLWIFGKTIEDATGHVRFIIFYFLCGIIAIMPYILLNPASQNPIIGASGAISGVLGAYLRLFPHSRIVAIYLRGIYPTLGQVPAEWVLIFWYGLQLLYGISADTEQTAVAWEVHLSGFTAGMLFVPLFYRATKST